MDLRCLELRSLSVGIANPLESSSLASKSGQKKSSLRKSQSKRSAQRKTSPLGWFPRKKGDSYLNRKIKKLQEEVGGMNQTLDETLGDSNPHYCRIVREQMAVREAACKAMELRKAGLVEASWCRILRAARIPSSEAETLMENAEKAAVEAFEAASALGVIMHDKPNSSRKQYRIKTSGIHGGGSPTHTVTASFETAFDVDKEVAAAVKTAFAKLANCPSLSKAEIKDLLRKISENPDQRDGHEITDMSSECDTEVEDEVTECEETSSFKMRQLQVKRPQSFGKFSREKLVDMMLERLQGLQEDQLSSLASIVATCGLSEALAEVGNERLQTTNIGPTVSDHGKSFSADTRSRRDLLVSGNESQVPSLDKYLVKHMTKLERDVYEAKKASKDVPDKGRKVPQGVASDTVPDLGSILVKHSSRLEKEIEEAKKNAGVNPRTYQKNSIIKKTALDPVPDLKSLLVKKHVSRLEKEVKETIRNCGKMYENVKKQDTTAAGSVPEVSSLDSCMVKHVSKLEKEVQEAKKRNKDDLEARSLKIVEKSSCLLTELGKENIDLNNKPILTRRQVMDREIQETWGGLGLGESKKNTQKGPESNKTEATEQLKEEARPVLSRRQARDKEMQDAWGGLGLGESNKAVQKRPESKKTEATEQLEEEINPVLSRRQARDKEMQDAWGGLGLGDSSLYQTVNKHKRKPESEKIETATVLLTRRQARDREMQEAWGGLDLGNAVRPSLSKLEREKAAWIKAEEEERTQGN